jgi:hypothetical protein
MHTCAAVISRRLSQHQPGQAKPATIANGQQVGKVKQFEGIAEAKLPQPDERKHQNLQGIGLQAPEGQLHQVPQGIVSHKARPQDVQVQLRKL